MGFCHRVRPDLSDFLSDTTATKALRWLCSMSRCRCRERYAEQQSVMSSMSGSLIRPLRSATLRQERKTLRLTFYLAILWPDSPFSDPITTIRSHRRWLISFHIVRPQDELCDDTAQGIGNMLAKINRVHARPGLFARNRALMRRPGAERLIWAPIEC